MGGDIASGYLISSSGDVATGVVTATNDPIDTQPVRSPSPSIPVPTCSRSAAKVTSAARGQHPVLAGRKPLVASGGTAAQVVKVVEEVIGDGGRPRWIDYKMTFATGDELNRHVIAYGDYDTRIPKPGRLRKRPP
jgi:hypothetical protein